MPPPSKYQAEVYQLTVLMVLRLVEESKYLGNGRFLKPLDNKAIKYNGICILIRDFRDTLANLILYPSVTPNNYNLEPLADYLRSKATGPSTSLFWWSLSSTIAKEERVNALKETYVYLKERFNVDVIRSMGLEPLMRPEFKGLDAIYDEFVDYIGMVRGYSYEGEY